MTSLRSIAWDEPEAQQCPDCGGQRYKVSGEVDEDEQPVAVYIAYLYHHDGMHEVFLDLVVGPWEEDADPSERLTFSTRTGPVDDGSIATTLLDGGYMTSDDPMWGTKVSREDGLVHPLIPTVWRYLDSIVEEVPAIAGHLAPTPPGRPRRWWGSTTPSSAARPGRSWRRRDRRC
ncbi:hypothetical protein [Actinotalea sp. C106]|uniref:hypothetical protein n=1 Tax=Actinotalea sp. C106 TaxID=2908644 RepID=UPI002027CAA1|nr:hypothetical protein [Actinotalea sp. C106]